MNYRKYIPWGIIAVLLVILFTRQTETITVEIPAKTGKFEQVNPEPIVQYDTITEGGSINIVEIQNPINKELLDKYNNLKDSLSKNDFVKDRLTERTYRETYQDSTQRIIVETKVIGTMESQKVDYEIFPSTIEIKVKPPKYNVFLGTFVGIPSQDITKPSIGVNIAVKSPKNIYSIGIDNQKNIMAGVAFKLF